MNVLLTGATGFIGQALMNVLAKTPTYNVSASLRRERSFIRCPQFIVGDINLHTDWSQALAGQHVIIHAAASAHMLDNGSVDSLNRYREVNVEGTINLARQSTELGVKRLIFISSIGVNGNASILPFTCNDSPAPINFYAQSKLEAEKGLLEIQHETGLEVVIIRPPLVYGANAPGNFGSLIRWMKKGVPLPLGAIHNKRSLMALDNLVDLIITCIDHPAAANQVFLAGDGQDLSTTELLQGVAKAMGKPARLIPVPSSLLMLGATLLGKKDMAQRLLGSLQVDISHTCETLGWKPPISVEEGLRRCFDNASDKEGSSFDSRS